MKKTPSIYAHSTHDAPVDGWQPLSDHLLSVSQMAREFAAPFEAGEWAALAGLVHDAGKASSAFQQRLGGSAERVDHSSAGAQLLAERYGEIGRMLAYVVAGHHGGLSNKIARCERCGRAPLDERLAKGVEPYDRFFELVDLPSSDQIARAMPSWLRSEMTNEQRAFAFPFLLQMIYSCVVDSDYLDTECFLDEPRFNARFYTGKSLSEMGQILESHIRGFATKKASGNEEIFNARAEINEACASAASGVPGLYSLTVPTGGGKTLASLSFALAHALKNGQQRVIYVAPYTSIIEQVAQTFKDLFGVDSVLEHHSNYDFGDSEDDGHVIQQRLAMENWDVPLVVTTNVQLFESMFTAKPSRSRKMHNIANSVIILDEVQALPDGLLKPCLAAIEELCAHYGTTVVLCTATQPALDAKWPFLSRPTEIVPERRRHEELFSARVEIECMRGSGGDEVALDDLVEELCQYGQALCVVSSRKAASMLYDAIAMRRNPDHVHHLSAFMVPEHRSQVISRVKDDLKSGKPCVVVSTQLIEAGVDIDFPVVLREVAGIDSIKQAAGRCNREGKRPAGCVRVFDCPDLAVRQEGWLSRMRMLGKEVIEYCDDPFGPSGVKSFFEKRYNVEDTDVNRIYESMADVRRAGRCNWEFDRYDHEFKFIDDSGVDVFVPWGEQGQELLARMRADDLDIDLSRKAQRFTVSVPRWQFEKLREGHVSTLGPFAVLEPFGGALFNYSDKKGLVVNEEAMTLMV